MEAIYRFRIKPGKAGAFVEYTKKQEANPPRPPPGWTYKATYFVVQGFGEYDAETRWELEDYATLGSIGGSAEWDAANKEFFDEYYDDRFPMSTILVKSANDVYVPEGY